MAGGQGGNLVKWKHRQREKYIISKDITRYGEEETVRDIIRLKENVVNSKDTRKRFSPTAQPGEAVLGNEDLPVHHQYWTLWDPGQYEH